eukprot:scaffold77428_cov55-Attheya_sp.AAC.2
MSLSTVASMATRRLVVHTQTQIQTRTIRVHGVVPSRSRRGRLLLPSRREASSSSSTGSSHKPHKPPTVTKGMDPHAMADEFVKQSHGRMPGTEALQSLTMEQKAKNFATAGGLMGFCVWVWWYSIQSVGKSGGKGLEDLQAEAQEARDAAAQKSTSQQEAEDLVGLEMSVDTSDEDLVIAVAAPDHIAQQEEDENRAARDKKRGKSTRPMWKKIVLFWQKE